MGYPPLVRQLLGTRGRATARVLRETGEFAVKMGHTDSAVAAASRAVTLDPLGRQAYSVLGLVLFYARQYEEAIGAYQHSLALDPDDPNASAMVGFAQYALGRFQSASESCETKP